MESMKAEGQAPLAQQIETALQKLTTDAKQKSEEMSHATGGLFLKMKNIGTLCVLLNRPSCLTYIL